MHDKQVGGVRLGVISNAGFETVGMADAIKGQRYAVEIAIRVMLDSDQVDAVVVDSGPPYEPLVRALRLAGVPVFPSADQAIRSLGRYLCHRVDRVCSGSRVAEAVAVS